MMMSEEQAVSPHLHSGKCIMHPNHIRKSCLQVISPYAPAAAHAMLAAQLVWEEAAGDSWLRYMCTYTAGARYLYRKELPNTHDQQDFRAC